MGDYKLNHFSYEIAAMIEELASNASTMIEIRWEAPGVTESIVNFSKISILHYYIGGWIQAGTIRNYRKMRADLECAAPTFESMFKEHGIPYISFYDYFRGREDFADFEWLDAQEESFYKLFDIVIEEVFYLLFANRAFLLNFNISLAAYLSDGNVAIPPQYLDKKGVLKRKRIPHG